MVSGRIERYPSPAVRHAFLSAQTVQALKHWRNPSERDIVAYRKAAEFLGTVLRGDEVVRERRVTATAATEAATYGWAVSAYSVHASRERKTTRENLSNVFEAFRSGLLALSEHRSPQIGEAIVPTLESFFRSLREVAGRTTPQSTDRVTLRTGR